MKMLGASVAVALLLATSACGGGGKGDSGSGSSRPSASELSKVFTKGAANANGQKVKLTKAQADCAAKVFVKSKVSDQALEALVKGNKKYKESKKDDAALQKVLPQLQKCAS